MSAWWADERCNSGREDSSILVWQINYRVCSIEESKDIDEFSLDELQSSLIVHEQKFQKHNGEEQPLKVIYEDRFKEEEVVVEEVFEEEVEAEGVKLSTKPLLNVISVTSLDIFSMSVQLGTKKPTMLNLMKWTKYCWCHMWSWTKPKEDAWFLDSGCNNHICGDKALLCELNEGFWQMVKLGNNSRMPVLRKGNVRLQLNGFNHVVTQVFYVPEFEEQPVMYWAAAGERGLAILIQSEKCKIYHPEKGLIIQIEMTTNKMFVLLANSQSMKDSCFHTTTSDLSHLWHYRYGHLSHKGLRTLQFKKMVHGLPQLPASKFLCTYCMIGKQHWDLISKKSIWKASQTLQFIHADICGPNTLISNSKKRYLLSFIDDFSRKTWVYFLIEKSEAFIYFEVL